MKTKFKPILTGKEAPTFDQYIEGEWMLPPKYESIIQKGLYFWAESNGGGAGAIESYGVVAQAEGFPPTEAFDDWFCHLRDADEIAQKLAKNEAIN